MKDKASKLKFEPCLRNGWSLRTREVDVVTLLSTTILLLLPLALLALLLLLLLLILILLVLLLPIFHASRLWNYKITNDTMTISNGNHSFVRLVVATLSLIVTNGNADECHLCYREDRFISTLILQNVVLSRIAIFVNHMN
jgi:hypothetical protein